MSGADGSVGLEVHLRHFKKERSAFNFGRSGAHLPFARGSVAQFPGKGQMCSVGILYGPCSEGDRLLPYMGWTKKRFSKERVDAAGLVLIKANASDKDQEDAEEVINNWRSCHAFPLNTFQ